MIQNSANQTQILLLTGYLGAGKTTLIQYILKQQNKFKIAVIQNEFADEMGIEAPLIQDFEGKPFDLFYELPNGCICCTAKDDLIVAVQYFIEKAKDLDYILVETNGLADPSSTIQSFWVDKELKFPGQLQGILSIVPSHRFNELKSDQIFIRQLVHADLILLNYKDKVDNIEILEQEIKQINPTAQQLSTSYCQFDLEQMFSIKPNQLLIQNPISEHNHCDKEISHLFLILSLKLSQNQWERNFGTILWEKQQEIGMEIMRLKGILMIEDESFIYQIQGQKSVNDTFEITKTDVNWNNLSQDDQKSKILIIGKNIQEKEILQLLNEIA